MDKNMIHIDDLVRQRLGGGQEPERPGAWLTMRELLDKEMPETAAIGYNWRRVLGYFAMLLFISTATIGGYHYINQHSGESQLSGGSSPLRGKERQALNNPNGSQQGASNAIGGNETIGTPNNNGSVTAAASNPSTLSTSSNENGNHSTATPSGNSSTSNHSSTSTNSNLIASVSSVTGHYNPAHLSHGHALNSNATSNNGSKTSNPALTPSGMGSNALTVTDQDANSNTQDGKPMARAHRERMHSTPSSTRVSNPRLAVSNIVGSGMNGDQDLRTINQVRTALTSGTTSGVKSLGLPHLVYDTIERIEIVARRIYDANSQRIVYRIDTFPLSNVVVARYVQPAEELAFNRSLPADKQDARTGNKNARLSNKKSNVGSGKSSDKSLALSGKSASAQVVPNAQNPEVAAADKAELVPLANFKVSSKHVNFWEAEKFNSAINRFKFNLAKIQMYPGMMAGINGSVFTPNSLGGFQVGLTSLFVLNDWWSLLVELKYLHQFNTGTTVRDDYMSVVPGSGNIDYTIVNNQTYKEYTWKDQNVNHYFNYDVIRTIQMPLALRYSWGRFYAQGGLNFVYSTPIQAKEVTNEVGNIVSHRELRPDTHDDQPFITNDHALVKITDFNSRFGTGYLLGAGFSFTPSVYLDFRISQTFWDNSQTEGARMISRELLKTPSLQLSVGYRFSTKH